MIELHRLETYLADLLDVSAFDDYCVNGIQIEGCQEIRKVVTGVSASASIFRTALERGVEAIILHHGLFWKNSPHPMALTGILRNRVKLLMNADISLLGYHLPLDAHPTLGNNAVIGKSLGLTDITFVSVQGVDHPIAALGKLPVPVSFSEFKAKADEIMEAKGLGLDFSNKLIEKVFILSGSGGGYYSNAAEAGADLMITGELREESVRAAEELGLSVYAAGHYNSEKWGIRALGEHLHEKFNLDVEFVDVPNPV